MEYFLRYSPAAQKQLDRLTWRDYLVVYEHVIMLKDRPNPQGAIKLKGSNFYRIRAGRFRIIYQIDIKQKLIEIVRVMHRSEKTYRGL